MSDSGYLKCSCSYCQGHIEFPAHALGITTTCPHCGVETTLVAPAGTTAAPPPPPPPPKPTATPAGAASVSASMTPVDATPTGSKFKKVLNIVGSVLAGLFVLGLVGLKAWKYFRRAGDVVEAVKGDPKPKPDPTSAEVAPMPTPVAVPTSVVLAKGTPPARKPGDDLQLLGFEVHKAKDGNLQYIVGVVTNHAAKQYFNVKLTFDLTRQGGKTGDTATDTLRNLPANVGSTFKVNIIGTAPVTAAALAKLEGEKE